MPSTSGGALRRHLVQHVRRPRPGRFYALDVGRGVATALERARSRGFTYVSMPSMSGGALRREHTFPWVLRALDRFYALDVGRGVATGRSTATRSASSPSRFYALDVGRGVATH